MPRPSSWSPSTPERRRGWRARWPTGGGIAPGVDGWTTRCATCAGPSIWSAPRPWRGGWARPCCSRARTPRPARSWSRASNFPRPPGGITCCSVTRGWARAPPRTHSSPSSRPARWRRTARRCRMCPRAWRSRSWNSARWMPPSRGFPRPATPRAPLQWVLLNRGQAEGKDGFFVGGSGGLKRSLTPMPDWARPNTRQLADAFVLYLKEQLPQSRRALTLATRRPIPEQAQWTANFTSALHRREAERAYATGNMRVAEKALKAALALSPDNAALQHNLACVAYRGNKAADAVATWRRLEGSLPQATLNLGIDAQERRHNVGEAVDAYRRYLAAGGGTRNTAVREWKDRLQMICGRNDAPPASPNPSSATASETTP